MVLDPKGEILRDTGYLLEQQGYDIKVLDLINTSRSHGFNPFVSWGKNGSEWDWVCFGRPTN